MTNYEKIKVMSVEDMAKLLCDETSICEDIRCKIASNCKECILKYLESEAIKK